MKVTFTDALIKGCSGKLDNVSHKAYKIAKRGLTYAKIPNESHEYRDEKKAGGGHPASV